MDELFDYQEAGARRLSTSAALYLGDDPGLGKSAQVVRALDYNGADRVLIGAPASLKRNWHNELRKFSISDLPVQIVNTGSDKIRKGTGIVIVNYDLIIRPAIHRQIRDQRWDVMNFDESHKLKNPYTKTTRAVLGEKGITKNANQVWFNSGTPAPNHPGELYAVLASCYPKATRGMDYETWLNYYCYTMPTEHGIKVLSNKSTITQLRADLRDFMLRRKRGEVLKDLPELLIGSLVVENEDALSQIKRYTQDHPEIEAMLGADMGADMEDWVEDAQMSTLRKLCGMAKAYALVDEIVDELEGGKEQIVLMCWHKATIDIFREKLAKYGIAHIDGRVPVNKRQDEVDRFNNHGYTSNCRVFVGQILAAGVGHTMTNAHDMIVVEPSWVPGENFQAMLRIHRIGQLNKCLVRFAQLAGSIDEAIMGSAERKAKMLAELY